MRKLFLPAILLALSTNLYATELIEAFNGKDLTGWHIQGDAPAKWYADNGLLTVKQTERGRGWLRFGNETWSDFRLSLEWKAEQAANSGIFFRVPKGEKVDPTWDGIEIQICDDHNYPIFHKGPDSRELSGALYGVVPVNGSHYRGVLQWNKFELIVKGARVKLFYNGEKALDTFLEDHHKPFYMWKASRSALAQRPRSGYIGLQAHKGSQVWFRNIYLERL